jgi:uncharacterized membrane protein YgcG
MQKTILIMFLIFGFLAFTEKSFGQEFYKWVDEKGTVHFSDTPPSPTLNQGKEPPKENGIEVLKKLETGNQPKGATSSGKSTRIGYTQGSGSSSSGGSTTIRSGRS